MGRKAKIIEKEDKEDRPQAESKKGSTNDHDIFSQSFKERLSQFVVLTREVLNLKGKV